MRLIDADELLKVITENSYMLCDVINSRDKGMFLCGIEQAINEQPTVEQKHGHWIGEQRERWIYAKCSECGKVSDTGTPYCPHCGAKMDEVTE